MAQSTPVLVLFRNDLRTSDHPALYEAAKTGQPVVALYVWDENLTHPLGEARLWWLHHSLKVLASSLKERYGVQLVLKRGDTFTEVQKIASEVGAGAVYFHRAYYENDRHLDEKLKKELGGKDFHGTLLFEPWEMAPKTAPFYKVFTPFWKSCLAKQESEQVISAPLPAPTQITAHPPIKSDTLEEWSLLPTTPDWSTGFDWQIGEDAAQEKLDHFLAHGVTGYKELRNRPDLPHTSGLSPYLANGEISPRQIYAAAENARGHAPDEDIDHFLSEVGWREFSYHLLYHLDDLPTKMLRNEFEAFPWRNVDTSEGQEMLKRWQKGQTGYPIVDAGMRELWTTGWMHNRVRMIVASFLVKHLLIHWHEGEKWFWDTLLDADLANNSASWQWVSGCGTDAAPYFRIFNPITQGLKFDPDGTYTKKWVPELKHVPLEYLFSPWEMTPMDATLAGVTIGEDYPAPLVEHKAAREAALDGYGQIKKS